MTAVQTLPKLSVLQLAECVLYVPAIIGVGAGVLVAVPEAVALTVIGIETVVVVPVVPVV